MVRWYRPGGMLPDCEACLIPWRELKAKYIGNLRALLDRYMAALAARDDVVMDVPPRFEFSDLVLKDGVLAPRNANQTVRLDLTEAESAMTMRRILHIAKYIIDALVADNDEPSRNLYITMRDELNISDSSMDYLLGCVCHVAEVSYHHLPLTKEDNGHVYGGNATFEFPPEAEVPGNKVECAHYQRQIPGNVAALESFTCDAKFLLVVQKTCTLRTLRKEKYAEKQDCIIVSTNGGFPSYATRFLIRCLVTALSIPAYLISNLDLGGLELACTLSHGSKASVLLGEAQTTAVPSLKWLGLRHDDVASLDRAWIKPLTDSDADKLHRLADRPHLAGARQVRGHVRKLTNSKRKIGLGAIQRGQATQLVNAMIARARPEGAFGTC